MPKAVRSVSLWVRLVRSHVKDPKRQRGTHPSEVTATGTITVEAAEALLTAAGALQKVRW